MLNVLAWSVGGLRLSTARAAAASSSAPGALAAACTVPARCFNSSAPIFEPSPSTASPSSPSGSRAAPAAPGSGASLAALLPLLAAQPSHYITLHIHGKPYLVTPGDSIRLPFKMPGVLPGDVLRFDRASIIGSRDFTLKGSPWINQDLFECRAVVIGTDSEPMRLKIKKKQRERKTKTVKSKHKYTVLRVSELNIRTTESATPASES